MPKRVSSVCKQNFSKSSYAHIESSIHNPAKKFSSKFERFLVISEKYKNTYNFFKNVIFFQDFLWTRKFQFWQSCSMYFDRKVKKFAE